MATATQQAQSEQADLTVTEFTKEEARKATDQVKADMRDLWLKIYELHQRKAHIALGYERWEMFCFAEFNISRSRSYQLIDAAKTEAKFPPEAAGIMDEDGKPIVFEDTKVRFSEAQLHELAKAEKYGMTPWEAWQKAQKLAKDAGKKHPTAAMIREAITGVKETKEKVTPIRAPEHEPAPEEPEERPREERPEEPESRVLPRRHGSGHGYQHHGARDGLEDVQPRGAGVADQVS